MSLPPFADLGIIGPRAQALRPGTKAEPTSRRTATSSEPTSGNAPAIPDSFLEVPAALRLLAEPDDSDPELATTSLPAAQRYELGDVLGEGGMGQVVAAYDRQLDREVALKLLTLEDSTVHHRLLEEARAQARVHHPNVLEIYDHGELAGRPFIAMRRVAGESLAAAAPALALEQKVKLLAQAAEGLHAAHREGLLHRDIKPSNILIERDLDGELRALVSDFGLAQEIDRLDPRSTPTLAGSPYYIAPECLAEPSAAADRRTDVYSLGVTLFVTLIGDLPVAGNNTLEILRQVRRHELTTPRQLHPALPAELEAIILRCLAQRPSERYGSARAVAEELHRFLDGEVVEAHAAGLTYRWTRFVLRHRLAVGFSALALAALIIAALVATVFGFRAQRDRQRAEVRQGQAEELLRFMVVDLRDKLDALGRLDLLDDVGSQATEYFAAVPPSALSPVELLRRSRVLHQIGEVLVRQGKLADAVAPFADSRALAEHLVRLDPDDGERLFELGQASFWLGFVHWRKGDLAAARGPFEEYLEISRQLVTLDPERRDWQRELSYAHSNLGSLRQAEGDLEGALGELSAALELDRRLVATDPGDGEARSELAATHNAIGRVLQDLGRLAAAGDHFAADVDQRQRLAGAEDDDPRRRQLLALSLNRLGSHRSLTGDWPAAERSFERAADIFTRLVAHDPSNADWRFQLATSHLHRGRAAFARGDIEGAAAAWRQQRLLLAEILANDSPRTWWRTHAVGLYHRALLADSGGKGARADLEKAIEILQSQAADRAQDRAVHRWLSQTYLLLGRLSADSQAPAAFSKALDAIAPLAAGSSDPRLLAPWADALRCLGREAEGRPLIARLDALGYAEPGLATACRPPSTASAAPHRQHDVLPAQEITKSG
ncbi:MAG: protein kinase [Acidobacteriota bacterium]